MAITPSQFEAMQARCNQGRMTSEGDQELARAAKQPESALHDKIIAYCNQQWPRWKFIHARMDQRSTIAVGCQDFTIFAPGRVLCIECKKQGGKLSIPQLEWKLEMQKLGHVVHVMERFEEFVEIAESESEIARLNTVLRSIHAATDLDTARRRAFEGRTR